MPHNREKLLGSVTAGLRECRGAGWRIWSRKAWGVRQGSRFQGTGGFECDHEECKPTTG